MENLKIRVNNKRERIEIQELLFEIGYHWQYDGTNVNNNDYVQFIYAKTTKLIFYGLSPNEFIAHPSKKITIKDLKAMVKPKHPKVWAWDDDVTEAFETYLIAEFKGMEDNLNHLVVGENWVTDFENKHFFETYLFLNISHTNPNINPTVEAIAHRIKKEFEKHPDLDWAMIAAHKIYSSHIKESK